MSFAAFLAIAFTMFGFVVMANRRRRRRERFIDEFVFPAGIRDRVRRRYPHLTDAQLDQILEALRDYFHLCRKAGKRMLAMPSQVVDAAWHEFILVTRSYQHFCRRGLGRFLNHTPAETLRAPTAVGDNLKRAWALACRRAGLDPAKGALPLLFAIDRQPAIADGFHCELDCTRALAAAQGSCLLRHTPRLRRRLLGQRLQQRRQRWRR